MPENGVECISHEAVLSYEEIERIARCAAALGVNRVRFTGGEPLVRRGLPGLIARVKAIPGIRTVTLTSNGIFLGAYARELAAAGLDRVNVSLDSLRSDTFARITRGGCLEKVMAGIGKAEAAGLKPIKINMVVMRGINDGEIVDFAHLTLNRDWQVRFIEYMPVGEQAAHNWQDCFMSVADIKERLADLGPLQREPGKEEGEAGPAISYRLPGALGLVGFISALSEHFCDTCNRLRITSDGKLRSCLLAGGELDLKAILRTGGTDADLAAAFRSAFAAKPLDHGISQSAAAGQMSRVGG